MQVHAHLCIASSLDGASVPDTVRIPGLDVHHTVVAQLGIDDARALVMLASRRPVERQVRSFVVCCNSLSVEAQNALLKLFEEPPHATEFFLVVPHASKIIPTLRSRLVLAGVAEGASAPNEDVAGFLAASYAERLATIAALAKAGEGVRMESLATALTAGATEGTISDMAARQALAFTEPYMHVKGGSKKMLLEHLALALPVG